MKYVFEIIFEQRFYKNKEYYEDTYSTVARDGEQALEKVKRKCFNEEDDTGNSCNGFHLISINRGNKIDV